VFTGVGFLIFSRYLTRWSDLAALKVVLGALVPLVAALLYFLWIGALEDLWLWTVVYNVSVYAPETAKGISETVGLLWRVFVRVFRVDLLLLVLAAVGLILFAIERVKARLRPRNLQPRLFEDAIVIVPLIYLAFCFINLQSGPDLIPLFPFIGMFAGWLLTGGLRSGGRLAGRVPAVAIIVLFALIAFRSVTYRVGSELTLQDQERVLEAISAVVSPQDAVYVHGTVEILVLLNRPNLNPHVDLRKGKDEFLARRTPGGFSAFITEMEAAAPKLVAISRAGRLTHRAELVQWIEDNYDPLVLPGYEGVYRRRQ
jgi:hypothetical protein